MESQDRVEGGGSHFDDRTWLELARKMVAPDRAAQMHAHLDAGCEPCCTQYAMWRLVVETAEHEMEYEPPESAVHAVENAFSLSRKTPLLSRLAETAMLVFDSFRQPLPAGIRGVPSQEARHVLYESGDVVIDIRLEDESQNVTWLAGQVLQKNAPVETTAGAGIVLVQEPGNLVACTIANRMGEFQLECGRNSEVTVFVEVPGGRIVSVTLPVV